MEKEVHEINAATKRKNADDDEEDDEEDDSGNWKRQRKTEYPVAYDFQTICLFCLEFVNKYKKCVLLIPSVSLIRENSIGA